jgi:hypothetical protein
LALMFLALVLLRPDATPTAPRTAG